MRELTSAAGKALLIAGTLMAATAQSIPPRIFYSDVDSGPNSGGENNNGLYVTIYGRGFGSAQSGSYVTVGGGQAAAYPVWSDTKIAFQLGAAAQTGNIVVSTSAGSSNGLPFTVRAGNIYFVAQNGSNSNAGTVSAPWATLMHARDTMAAGDTVYVRNGIAQTTDDGQGYSSCLTIGANSGRAGFPKALVVYPGESATIGNVNNSSNGGCNTGVRAKGQTENYWTIAGFTIRGGNVAVNPWGEIGWRIIANDISCPNGNAQAGCLDETNNSSIYIYGNNIHHVATNLSPSAVTALYHGVYLSDATSDVWFGWNTIAYVQGCRGLQQNSNNPNADAFGIHIHDNIIHDTQCDGIVMTTVNPAQGTVEIYNNIIYNAGTGPNNAESSGAWSCINVQGWDTTAQSGSGVIDIYNNTLYSCGNFASPPYTGSNGGIMWVSGGNGNKYARIRNNIIDQTGNVPYLVVYNTGGGLCTDAQACPGLQGSNNLYFGGGAAPLNVNVASAETSNNPMFLQPGTDFHLSAGSPAATAGIPTASSTDFDGVTLPQGAGYPIGAYALVSSNNASPSAVNVAVTPPSMSLMGNQSQSFTATVSGSANNGVSWSMSPNVGTLSSSGVYTAPGTVSSSMTVLVTATSAADSSKLASATVTLVPIAVSVSSSVSLAAGQSNQFTATVTGTSQNGVSWSMSPQVGTLSSTGLYTAPATVSGAQSVTITATSVADPTKSASSTVALTASLVVSVNPSAVTLGANGTKQFTATVTGASNTNVVWSVSPSVGSISTSGLYTAPASVTSLQSVTVQATSVADSTRFATAVVTLAPIVAIGINPPNSRIAAGQTQQFTAAVTGTTNTAVQWLMSPNVGTLSGGGLYTAPSSVSSAQMVTITAVSAADATKSVTATVTINPASISISPQSITMQPGQTMMFAPAVSGGTGDAPAVTWSLSPSVGSISSTGVYQAPASITQTQTVTVIATMGTNVATAMVLLNPPGFGAKFSTASGSLVVEWTAPSSPNSGDWIALSAVNAPYWWTIWSQKTNGASQGTANIPLPSPSGVYELRYYQAGGFTVIGRSAGFAIRTSGYTVTAPNTVAAGSPISFGWTADTGRTAQDYIGLYKVGNASDQPVTFQDTFGAPSGTLSVTAPSTPGLYELRYIVGSSGYTYLSTTTSATIIVH
ncbi:MAG TPA: choice-of-anchor Q domain-containing protein [Bryobacteraceae bacterium]|nr:choice-of-anchor Q domain-containing protein [Bryobacteraceae bacterium]